MENKRDGTSLTWVHILVLKAIRFQFVFSTKDQIQLDTNLSNVDIDHALAQLIQLKLVNKIGDAYMCTNL